MFFWCGATCSKRNMFNFSVSENCFRKLRSFKLFYQRSSNKRVICCCVRASILVSRILAFLLPRFALAFQDGFGLCKSLGPKASHPLWPTKKNYS